MSIKNWIKKNVIAIALATGRVEEKALTQSGSALEGGTGQHQDVNEGKLAHSLLNGVVTQEVEELRWRMYKVLQASEKLSTRITNQRQDVDPEEVGNESINHQDDDIIFTTETSESKPMSISKIKVDTTDDYKVIMVISNAEITTGRYDGMNMGGVMVVEGEIIEVLDEDGDTRKTLGSISSDNLGSNENSVRPIYVVRDFKPKFELEKYTKRLVVREINGDQRLLEFYISKYPDTYDRKTQFLISEIKKAIKNPRASDMLDITGVNYVTNKSFGSKDNQLFEYDVVNFDKIVEFDGHYVIKFVANVITNGLDIFEKYKDEGLELRYKNKEAK